MDDIIETAILGSAFTFPETESNGNVTTSVEHSLPLLSESVNKERHTHTAAC